MDTRLADRARRNRDVWDAWAFDYADWTPREWAGQAPSWGEFSIPEAEVGVLPASIDCMDANELGCGTTYFSALLAKLGARPVGIDNSPKQLDSARRKQAELGIEFPLRLGRFPQRRQPSADRLGAAMAMGRDLACA
jgi:SAM-dependent methyltransferase